MTTIRKIKLEATRLGKKISEVFETEVSNEYWENWLKKHCRFENIKITELEKRLE